MRDADHMAIGANPIFPVLTDQATGAGKVKKDNAEDVLARLDRVRDHKHVDPFKSYRDAESAAETDNDSLTFADLIDTINPLQHIPLVSTVYRSITGDEISPAAKVAGNALFLGPIGAVGALVDVAVDQITGKDIGEHVLALFGDDEALPADTETVEQQVTAPKPGAEFGTASGQVLPATEPFFFGAAGQGGTLLSTESATGFASSSGPVALEALPADILAALYNGQQSIEQPTASQFGQYPASGQFTGTSEQAVEEMPRWSLFTSPDDVAQPQTSPSTASQAYGDKTPSQTQDQTNEPGAIGYQAGWFSTIMPDIAGRYEHSATLQRQTQQPIVDIQQ